jgi:hypothetical protein
LAWIQKGGPRYSKAQKSDRTDYSRGNCQVCSVMEGEIHRYTRSGTGTAFQASRISKSTGIDRACHLCATVDPRAIENENDDDEKEKDCSKDRATLKVVVGRGSVRTGRRASPARYG